MGAVATGVYAATGGSDSKTGNLWGWQVLTALFAEGLNS